MFLAQRPPRASIERFLHESQQLPLSYSPVGIVDGNKSGRDVDEQVVAIGRGRADFERAREALMMWRQFDIGWVEAFPQRVPVAIGTNVGVLIRHLGFWSLNGCRVLYYAGREDDAARFGYSHGTLINHAESGEEIFEVFLDPATGDVMYRIRAISWPRAALARLGQPIVRLLQARFRRDSAEAMRRAVHDR